jgi:hypothetical protein
MKIRNPRACLPADVPRSVLLEWLVQTVNKWLSRSVDLWRRDPDVIRTVNLRNRQRYDLSKDGTLTYRSLTLVGQWSVRHCMASHRFCFCKTQQHRKSLLLFLSIKNRFLQIAELFIVFCNWVRRHVWTIRLGSYRGRD